MKKKKIFTLLSLFLLGIFTNAQNLEIALEKAGKNTKELEKVLKYFKKNKDIQKYEAAVFLIENMTLNHSLDCNWYTKNGQRIPFNDLSYPDFPTAKKEIDRMLLDKNILPKQIKTYDLGTVKANFLIENINEAFFVWKNMPWAQHYNFNTFCEYILPYRSINEPLQTWRTSYRKRNKEYINEIKDTKEPIVVLGALMKQMGNYDFVFNRKEPLPALGAQQLLFRKQGTCLDYANLAIYNTRSIGLATSFDFTPHYAASSNRHFWNTLVDEDGTHIPFDGYEYYKGIDPINKRLAKVMRRTYSVQKNSLGYRFKKIEIPKGFLQGVNFIDVTDEYISTTDIKYTFDLNLKLNYGLIHVFNLAKWRPVFWSTIYNTGKTVFKNMGRDVVYLPGYFKNESTQFEQYPILVKANGKQLILNPLDGSVIKECKLSRANEFKRENIDYNPFDIETGKNYKLFMWDNGWKLIGSNQKAQNDALEYVNIPANALYLLIPTDKGEYDGFERIFMIAPTTNQIIWY